MHVHMSPRLSNPILIRSIVLIVGRCLARDLRPVASADELWLRIQTIWNTLPQTDIKNLFNSMPSRVAALIAARGGHTKY
ncbi:transposable element Tc1 transposase [Trichonephila clavipes]|nr:transposable element Tc1 transposase [Trichonephila clavipes]